MTSNKKISKYILGFIIGIFGVIFSILIIVKEIFSLQSCTQLCTANIIALCLAVIYLLLSFGYILFKIKKYQYENTELNKPLLNRSLNIV
jgi:type III secretory pathway component EscU